MTSTTASNKTQSSSTSSKEDGYLASPSGACCLKGTLHEGEPRGKFIQINDIETYIAYPPSDKANGNILLYFPDVWGMFKNGLLVMDAFADAGESQSNSVLNGVSG